MALKKISPLLNEINIHQLLDIDCLLAMVSLNLFFFCQIVELVIAIKAIMVEIKPRIGIFEPRSHPKTITAPTKPKKIPLHCLNETLSPKIGPHKMFVNIG